uniref:Uncharacterized protein n=1 Tax=Neobodo designis TaxID=312471 RepID=A0A7S1W0R8_NEODS
MLHEDSHGANARHSQPSGRATDSMQDFLHTPRLSVCHYVNFAYDCARFMERVNSSGGLSFGATDAETPPVAPKGSPPPTKSPTVPKTNAMVAALQTAIEGLLHHVLRIKHSGGPVSVAPSLADVAADFSAFHLDCFVRGDCTPASSAEINSYVRDGIALAKSIHSAAPGDANVRWLHQLLVALLAAIVGPGASCLRPLWPEDRRTLLPPVDSVSAGQQNQLCSVCSQRQDVFARTDKVIHERQRNYGDGEALIYDAAFLRPSETQVTLANAVDRHESALRRDGGKVHEGHRVSLCPCADALPDAFRDALEDLGNRTAVRSLHVLHDSNTPEGRRLAVTAATHNEAVREKPGPLPGAADAALVTHVAATREVVEDLTGNFTHAIGDRPGAAGQAERERWQRDRLDPVAKPWDVIVNQRPLRDRIVVAAKAEQLAREEPGALWVDTGVQALDFPPYHRGDLVPEQHDAMAAAHADALDAVAGLRQLYPDSLTVFRGVRRDPLWVPAWMYTRPVFGLAAAPLPTTVKTTVFPLDGSQPRYLVTARSSISLDEWFARVCTAKPTLAAKAAQSKPAVNSSSALGAEDLDWTFVRVARDIFDALAALHNDAGVSHGRLTPGAVFFDSAGAAAAARRRARFCDRSRQCPSLPDAPHR